jgi:cation transport regulator ChaB
MPYERDRDLPAGVLNNLPPGGRALWRRVFNAVEKEELGRCRSAGEQDCTEKAGDLARQAAWSSVKRAGYEKGEDGNWQKTKGREEDLRAAKARSARYGIAFKPGKGNLTAPKDFPSDPGQYGDPVNLKYPLTPEERVRAAVAYFNQDGQREAGGYTTAEWAVIGQRIARKAGKVYRAGKIVDPKASKSVDQWEEVADTLHVSSEQFKAISEGRVTSAVINTRCHRTGGQRWITVSSGTFPDRMAEIVSLRAQQYALTWAQKTGHYGPLRLAHIPHPVAPEADIREQWKALVGDYVVVLDKGLLPMGERAYQKALAAFRAPSETRVRNLIKMVGKDLARLVVIGEITADVGTCDYQHLQGGHNPAYPGRFLVESGLYDDGALAYKARRYFDANPGEVSIGFLYDRLRLVVGKDGVVYPSYYNRVWRFERSLLPYGAAAFPASYLDGATGVATL